MALFPSAPKVTIRAPTPVFAGREVPVEVVVETDRDTKIDFIDARLEGMQGWTIGSGKHTVSERRAYPKLVARLRGEGTLVGVSTYVAVFHLPPDVPPSHSLTPAYATMTLKIHVSIPWWPDGRYKFALPVRIPPPASVVRTPVTMRSTWTTDARIELGLASARVIAGETVVGSCAVFHMDDRRGREIDLVLAPTLQLSGRGRDREREAKGYRVRISQPPHSAGTSVPFQFTLPATLTPTFQAATHSLSWTLRARTGGFFGGRVDVMIPLEVVDASALVTTTALTQAPALADERVVAVLAAFATAYGWRTGAAPPDPDPDDDRPRPANVEPYVEREAGASTVRITYSYRGTDGTFLVASVAHPPLGLGLVVTPGSSLRHVFFHDIEAGLTAWDREHHVTARSDKQAAPVLRAIVPALAGTELLGPMVRWDDDGIVFEHQVAAVGPDELLLIAGALDRVATAIGLGRNALTPPPDLVVDLVAWNALAGWLDAELGVGDLSITGTLDDVPVELGLIWDSNARPTGIHVEVGHAAGAGAALREVNLSLPRPALDALSTSAAERLLGQLTGWPDDIVDLRVVDGVAGATLRLATDTSADAARVRDLVEALRSVRLSLDAGAGPYR